MTYQPGKGQPGSRPDQLTANERRFLEGLLVRHPWRAGGWWPPKDMIGFASQGGRFAGMSAAGLHQTGASLHRKGYVDKMKREGRSPVEYRITTAGRRKLGTQAAEPASTSPNWQCPACRQWVTVTEAVHKAACTGPVACPRRNPHTPHGPCPGTAPEYPSETIETVTE